jgi:hypothetical protein
MKTTNTIIIGVTILAVVLLVLWAITRWGVFTDSEENANSGTERVQREAEQQQDFDVSVRKKARAYSLPVKIIGGSLGLLAVGLSGYAYLILKGGAPVELPYANAMRLGVVVCLALYAGVTVSNWKTRGELEIIYETDDDSDEPSEIVYYDPDRTEVNADGNPVVTEQFENLHFGLWGKFKLVKHARDLRTAGKPLGDRVTHEIPDHAVRVGRHKWVLRTQGQRVNEGPDVAADYSYRPPDVLPHEVRVRRHERYQKMQTENESLRAQQAQLEGEVRSLRRELRTNERLNLDDVIDQINQLQEAIGAQNVNNKIEQNRTPERRPESQGDVPKMNGDREAEGVRS